MIKTSTNLLIHTSKCISLTYLLAKNDTSLPPFNWFHGFQLVNNKFCSHTYPQCKLVQQYSVNMHHVPDTMLKETENKNYESLFKLQKKALRK